MKLEFKDEVIAEAKEYRKHREDANKAFNFHKVAVEEAKMDYDNYLAIAIKNNDKESIEKANVAFNKWHLLDLQTVHYAKVADDARHALWFFIGQYFWEAVNGETV